MKIIEKIVKKETDMLNASPATIAFIGDSVTQGCFECFLTPTGAIGASTDRKCSYSTRLGQILEILFPRAQINLINAGISGDRAIIGAERLERDVLAYNPDLVVVSYGLNDCAKGDLDEYVSGLKSIFSRLKEKNIEVIFITENFMNTQVSPTLTDEFFIKLAKDFAKCQNEGILKNCFTTAVQICKEYNIPVCDMYSIWENLNDNGVNVTELLANKLNHPVRPFHYYMAIKLLETMLNN